MREPACCVLLRAKRRESAHRATGARSLYILPFDHRESFEALEAIRDGVPLERGTSAMPRPSIGFQPTALQVENSSLVAAPMSRIECLEPPRVRWAKGPWVDGSLDLRRARFAVTFRGPGRFLKLHRLHRRRWSYRVRP